MLDTYTKLATNRNIGILAAVALILVGIYFFTGLSSAAPTEKQVYEACQNQCETLKEASGQRKDAQIYEYCKKTYDVKTGALQGAKLKQNQTEYCSNGARCANLHTCETEEQTLDIQGCIDFMTQYHQTALGEDTETAQKHTEDILKPNNTETGVGTCTPKPAWYQEAFNQ
jgi:hypothetical protein